MAGEQASRLARLETLWKPPCAECRKRPVIVGVTEGEPIPMFPASCPLCRRRQPPVVVIVGVAAEEI